MLLLLPDAATKESDSSSDPSNQSYRGEANNNAHDAQSIRSHMSVLERVQTQLGFFNPRMKPVRNRMVMKFILIYVIMAVLMLGIFSIYWGSMMHRNDHMKYLKFLVMVEDVDTIDGVPPIFGDRVIDVVTLPFARYYGDWQVYTPLNFSEIRPKHSVGNTQWDVETLVHEQKFWGAIHVKPIVTHQIYTALLNPETAYNASAKIWRLVYETGRDFNNVPSYVVPNSQTIEARVLSYQKEMTGQLIDILRQQGKNTSEILDKGWAVLAHSLNFEMKDLRPLRQPQVMAPAQVGLIFLIIVTFFQFNFFVDFHKTVAGYPMKKPHYLLYRLLGSFLTYFWLSLMYSLISLAFQIDFTKAFGRGGFPVYWMTIWLTMCAVGGMNEIMAHVLIMVFPPCLGFWLIFWVISNVSCTFTPMALTANFYRYGYALPIYNANEIIKVVFFDTHKGHIGRNYGILVAWVVVTNILLALVLPIFGKVMGKKALKLKQEAEEEAARQKSV